MAQTLEQFVAQTAYYTNPQQPPTAPFEVCHEKFLKINMAHGWNEQAWIKMGTMVAYTGEIKFKREGVLEHGFKHALKKAISDEGGTLVKASLQSQTGQLFLADEGKRVVILRLNGDAIVVNGSDLLAFEPANITHKITMMKKLSSIVSSGLFNVKLQGHGCVAILTHGTPITLPLAPGYPPVYTDPQATVAWSANLAPDFHTDVSFKTFIGRGSGESFQMKFVPSGGPGFVVIQPFEEHPPVASSSSSSSSALSSTLSLLS